MKLYYQISQIKAKNGKAIKYRKVRSRSFVRAYLYGMFTQVSVVSCSTPDINNASHTPEYFIFQAPGGHDAVYCFYLVNDWGSVAKNGIVIGTGNTAVTSSDYMLQTRIVSGVATGEIEYFANIFTTVVVSAPNASFTVNRIFRNGSGGSVTIKEIGIYAMSEDAYTYCIIRDVLGVPVTMDDGDYLKITYTFQVTA